MTKRSRALTVDLTGKKSLRLGEVEAGHQVTRYYSEEEAQKWGNQYAETRAKLAAGETTPGRERKKLLSGNRVSQDAAPAKRKNQVAQDGAPAVKRTRSPRGQSMQAIAELLRRKSGCTRPEILEATGWKAVSVQQVSAALGLKLRIDKTNRPTKYFGE